jgi:hypothetical protein
MDVIYEGAGIKEQNKKLAVSLIRGMVQVSTLLTLLSL